MAINYLEEEFRGINLFKNEEILELNYLPEKILYREQELIMLSKIFIKLIENPFQISRKVMVQGDVGIGKTLITRRFGEMLLLSAKKRNLNIKYVHINCRKEKTSYKILHQILQFLNYPVPRRGFSPQELMAILQDYLESENYYLFLILDELNHLKKSDFDLIYSLSRMNDSNTNQRQYLSLISIVRDITLLRNLDESTISTLQGNVLTLKKYTKTQISEILGQRISLAIKNGVLSHSLINIIAENILDSGDIRKGLNIVRNCVKIAESREHQNVEIEDLNSAMSNLIPSLQDDAISILNVHQILLLLAITHCTVEFKRKKILISEIKKEYEKYCDDYSEIPRKNTQIWQNFQILKNYNLIEIDIRSKNIRGRTSFCCIKNIPPNILEEELFQRLRNLNNIRDL